ncbi:hypothetical protein INT46_008225 [Mucor plumbeus]|uniref:Uncharacterized protein n=1 Tax=Mucor plumbeus TaxID=97098 RepID=A0A8H7QTB2_9FUNG|nr:hypothetical protein INT46_008225 [Mucor plumbeus]
MMVSSKTENKSIAPALIELSGGINNRTLSCKNSNNIKKLTEYCKYFEKIHKYDDVMYSSITENSEIPNALRKLVAFIQKVPKILTWKKSVINYAIDLN